MLFIFPKNYDFSYKILGFIDYSTALINLIWGIIIFFFVTFLVHSLKLRICLFIILFLPLFLFSILRSHKENVFYTILYFYKFFNSQKILFYSKK